MKKIVLGLFSLVVCMLFVTTASVMAQEQGLKDLTSVSFNLSVRLQMLQNEEVVFEHHPELKDFSTKKYEKLWNQLTIDEKRQVVNLRIESSHERILHTIVLLSFHTTIFPYKGLGIMFGPSALDAVGSGVPVVVEKIMKEGPAVGILKPFDLILAVNEIRLDDFPIKEGQRMEESELKERLEEYRVKFLEAVKNSGDMVKLEISRYREKITVNVEKALVGKKFPPQIKVLLDELRDKKPKFYTMIENIRTDLDTASEKIVKSKFEEAFLVGFQDVQTIMKKHSEIVYHQTE